jgi:hypothetical protein
VAPLFYCSTHIIDWSGRGLRCCGRSGNSRFGEGFTNQRSGRFLDEQWRRCHGPQRDTRRIHCRIVIP